MTEQNGHALDFRAEKGRKNKRRYIFDFGRARICTHPVLREVVQGGHKYRCDACNYDFWLPTATMWPAHWGPIMAAFEILKFVKDFGRDALEQVYRTPIGQYDHSEHKPVLPEGKSLRDVIEELDEVDVITALASPHTTRQAVETTRAESLPIVREHEDGADTDGNTGGP